MRREVKGSTYRLHIELALIYPPIWRQIEVPSDIPLDVLHEAIQIAFGWDDSHLHLFRTKVGEFGIRGPDIDSDWEDEAGVPLASVCPRVRSRMTYEYDFGDDWQHEVQVIARLNPDPQVKLPYCLAGERAGPEEDSGGPYGYMRLLTILADRRHPDYWDMRDWVGPGFRPERLSLSRVNSRLRKLRW